MFWFVAIPIITFVFLIFFGAILAFAITRKKNHWWAHIIVVGGCVVYLVWGNDFVTILMQFSLKHL